MAVISQLLRIFEGSKEEQMALENREISSEALLIPEHLAIIMDGNGRWAQAQGKPRAEGHIAGVEALRRTLTAAGHMGVRVLTVYAFSTENWLRPKQEVTALMELLVKAIVAETPKLNQDGVALRAIGNLARLPEDAYSALQNCIEETRENSRMTLVLALSYSSRDELVRTYHKLLQERYTEVDEEAIEAHLDTAGLPPLDLLIRTGGEQRLSNFLLWQAAYAELYFSPTLWPDYGEQDLIEAFRAYSLRERRFGLTGEQIND